MRKRCGPTWCGYGWARLLPLLVLSPITVSCDSGELPASLLEEGVSWDLAELRKNTIHEVEYQFALRVPESREESIQGSVRVRFTWEDEDRRPIVFDFLSPQDRVSRVSMNGEEAEFRTVNDHVVLPVPRSVPNGPVEIEIDFTAGDESLNRNPDFLYALFVPERARYSLPLFDQPNLKARFALFLDLPLRWTAMANGRQIREAVEGDRRQFQFAPSDPLPTYLLTFVAGDFQRVTERRGDRVMEFLHRETDREKVDRNLDAIFDLHAASLDWLESYTAVPYPFQKIGFVAIPAFQYGGMEHPGAVFYRDSRLFLDESATQSELLGRASLIAHETAHMWFGDLVTMNWFDDVWTKEVFANFMAAKIVHPSFPELDHELRFLLAHHPAAYGVDRTEGANPIRQPLANLREAGSLYGPIIYQKAPVVMRQLELLVGEGPFREGMQEYLARFAFGNATWPDLIQILDRKSPEDLAGWSRVWVEEAGRPVVWAQAVDGPDGRLASLTLRQADPLGTGRTWQQPLSVALGYGTETERFPVRFTGGAFVVDGAAGREAPDFVLPDGWGEGYAWFRLDERSLEHLLEKLPELSDPVVRGSGWMALWDAVLEGDVTPGAFLALALRAVEDEQEEQILQWVLGSLETVYWTLIPDAERGARAPEVEAVLWDALSAADGPSRKSSLFRAYRSIALTPSALRILEEVWREGRTVPGLPLSESDKTDLAAALALREVDAWREILDVQLVNIENPDRRAEFEFLRPSLDADPVARETFFQGLRDPKNREKEPWVISGLSNLHHPLRREHALRLVGPGLELLEEVQRTGDIFFPARWSAATLSAHNSKEAEAIVRGFLDDRPDYPLHLRLKILQASDGLFRAAEILEGEGT